MVTISSSTVSSLSSRSRNSEKVILNKSGEGRREGIENEDREEEEERVAGIVTSIFRWFEMDRILEVEVAIEGLRGRLDL